MTGKNMKIVSPSMLMLVWDRWSHTFAMYAVMHLTSKDGPSNNEYDTVDISFTHKATCVMKQTIESFITYNFLLASMCHAFQVLIFITNKWYFYITFIK
jgi:hypothetical protein